MITLNEQQARLLILSILLKYKDILIPDSGFIEDLLNLIVSSGVEKRFVTKLDQYLDKLSTYGEAAIGGKGDPMEHLSGQTLLSSMRFLLNNANLRVLFSFLNGKVYLLSAFYERKGKRNTEYDSYIPVALQRLDELLKGE